MILRKDCSGKTDSLFSCDRCNALINGEEKITVIAYRGTSTVKSLFKRKWDLCPSCGKKLIRGVEYYKGYRKL